MTGNIERSAEDSVPFAHSKGHRDLIEEEMRTETKKKKTQHARPLRVEPQAARRRRGSDDAKQKDMLMKTRYKTKNKQTNKPARYNKSPVSRQAGFERK